MTDCRHRRPKAAVGVCRHSNKARTSIFQHSSNSRQSCLYFGVFLVVINSERFRIHHVFPLRSIDSRRSGAFWSPALRSNHAQRRSSRYPRAEQMGKLVDYFCFVPTALHCIALRCFQRLIHLQVHEAHWQMSHTRLGRTLSTDLSCPSSHIDEFVLLFNPFLFFAVP